MELLLLWLPKARFRTSEAAPNRETVATSALRVGRGSFELRDRMIVGVRVNCLELDEI